MTTPDGDPEEWQAISHEHWKATSYDDAMQQGIESLRRSFTLPERSRDHDDSWIFLGQRYALQAAAWFAFARELRGANTPLPMGPPPPPLPLPTQPPNQRL